MPIDVSSAICRKALVLSTMDLSSAKTRLSDAIKAWQDNHSGASNAALGRELSKTRETIRLWKDRESFPDLPDLGNVCEVLETTPLFILFGVEEAVTGTVRVAVTAEELELIRLFQSLSAEQQKLALGLMKTMQVHEAIPDNVAQIPPIPRKQ